MNPYTINAQLLHQDENDMLKLWLADKVIDAVGDEHDLS